MRSVWTLAWYSMIGDVRNKYRAKGRYFHYRAMLAEKTKTSSPRPGLSRDSAQKRPADLFGFWDADLACGDICRPC